MLRACALRAVHNAGLALLSSFLLAGILYELALHGVALAHTGPLHTAWVMFCDPSPHVMRNGRLLFLYYLNYITKYLELSDTVLLCLRGKPLPFLHVYHHASISFIWWMITNTAPGGDAYFSAAINSSVHVIMYLYYLLCILLGKDTKARAQPQPTTAAAPGGLTCSGVRRAVTSTSGGAAMSRRSR